MTYVEGAVNNPAVVTWNGNVAIDDTASVAGALTRLTRAAAKRRRLQLHERDDRVERRSAANYSARPWSRATS